MWVLWVYVLPCVLLLLWLQCVCCMWLWGRQSVLVFLSWYSWGVWCCLFVVHVVCCIVLGLVWRGCIMYCLGWGWGCLSGPMYVFHVGMIGCLLLLCLCRCVLILWWCRLRRLSAALWNTIFEWVLCWCFVSEWVVCFAAFDVVCDVFVNGVWDVTLV